MKNLRAIRYAILATFALVMLSLVFSPLAPIKMSLEADAQTRTRSAARAGSAVARRVGNTRPATRIAYTTIAKPGTPEYYRDDMIQFSDLTPIVVTRTDYNSRVGGDPQASVARGTTLSAPLPDEEDVYLKDVIDELTTDGRLHVLTMSGSGNMYLADMPLIDKYGKDVVVRWTRSTHKLLVTVNCGNWLRQVGREIVEQKITVTAECVRLADDDDTVVGVKIETYNPATRKTVEALLYDYHCGYYKVIIETTTNNPGECVPKCEPGTYKNLHTRGPRTTTKLSDFPEFEVKAELANLSPQVAAAFEAQYPTAVGTMVRFLDVWQEACLPDGTIKLVITAIGEPTKEGAKKKGKSLWGVIKWVLIVVAGVVGFILIKKRFSSKDIKVPIKHTNQLPETDAFGNQRE